MRPLPGHAHALKYAPDCAREPHLLAQDLLWRDVPGPAAARVLQLAREPAVREPDGRQGRPVQAARARKLDAQ